MFCNKEDVSSKKSKVVLGAVVGCCVLVLIIVLAVVLSKSKPTAQVLHSNDRLECPGFKDAEECKAHGCEYEAVTKGPSCYMKKDAFGFNVAGVYEKVNGRVYNLVNRSTNTPYGPSFSSVGVDITYINEEVIRVRIIDNLNKRYEVPAQKDFPLLQATKHMDPDSMNYLISASKQSEIFSFQIIRKQDKTVLWDTSIGGLVLSDKFLQISSYLPSEIIYGLGEHTHEQLRHDLDYKTWPIFSRDAFPEGGQRNLYGAHPYYTCLENSSNSHGVLLLNSNAMDVTLLPAPGITFRTVGGVLDLFFIVGTDPENLVELYTDLVGKPMIPPYWGLGFQLSRYGYNSIENLKNAVERTRRAGIAQDVQFLDIDHMEGNRDFTYDTKRFPGLLEYINTTRDTYGMKWIIILDPAIEAVKDYRVYESGLESDVFIKRSPLWKEDLFPEELRGNNVTYGKVWPETEVAFPNFLDDRTKNWWISTIVDYHKKLPFSGLWIDMNEPSNFGTNEDNPSYCNDKSKCWSLKCPNSPYEDPPYNPLKSTGSERLSEKTLCMESIHSDGTNNYRHYDVHSLYGWSQSQPSLEGAEKAINARSLVISRSTYPSSGRYAGHWLGDNKSSWDDLRRSIIGL
ncbi:sucrase-isomaltase, intestinal [Nephila pilipes]|uniref:Maltase n=1 Tax=Nephila pilipes TaxID=299642 RepID=A0A8X6TFP9_NEPPI|nr:sucrase-isomaltase, intestinal [Nephila pilipes]